MNQFIAAMQAEQRQAEEQPPPPPPKKPQIRDYSLYLKEKIYPQLQVALEKLVEHLIATNAVQEHQEKLRQQKVLDRLEQRKVEKERLKAELGSEYESSGDSIDLDDVQNAPGGDGRMDDSLGKMNEELLQGDSNLQQQVEDLAEAIKFGAKGGLANIAEDADEQNQSQRGADIDGDISLPEPERPREFDPIEFLSEVLKGNIPTAPAKK